MGGATKLNLDENAQRFESTQGAAVVRRRRLRFTYPVQGIASTNSASTTVRRGSRRKLLTTNMAIVAVFLIISDQ